MAASAYNRYNNAYIHGSAAPKRHAGNPYERPDVRAIPGSRTRSTTEVLPQRAITGVAIVLMVFALIAVASFGRIALSVMAVNTSRATSEVSSQLDDARSVGSVLEVEQSTLSNPEKIKKKAKKLGMVSPDSGGTGAVSSFGISL